MSLTVPKAGVIAGASAAPRIEADNTGEMIANFGQRMADVGFFIQKEREQRALGRARVAIARGLNDLQTKYQQIGDPDEIDSGYSRDSAALRGEIVDSQPAGIRDQVGLMFDEVNVSHATQIGRWAVQRRQSQEIANISALGNELTRTAGTAGPETLAAARAQMDQQLQSAVARGIMTPEEAQRTSQSFGQQASQARAARMLSDDPGQLVTAIDAGEFAAMNGPQLESWRARGTSAVAAAAARAEAEAKRLKAERLTVAAGVLKDGTAVYREGRDFARAAEVDELMADPAIAALPEAREYAAAQKLHHSMPEFAVLPLPLKREVLADLRKDSIDKAYENDVVEAVEAAIAADEKGFETDALGRAAAIGLSPAPALPDPGTASSEDMVQALRMRAAYGTSLQEQGYTQKQVFFTQAERETWKAAVREDASPADKARLAMEMAAGLGPDVEDAAAEIGADPLFAYVGGGLAHGLSQELGRQIFEGQRAIAGKHVRLPAPASRNQQFFAEFSDLFGDGTDQGWGDLGGARAQVIAATDALYAYRKRGELTGGNIDDATLDARAYLQAAHEVMGGTGDFDAGWFGSTKGGVQTVRDRLTILPPEISASNVESRLDALSAAMADPELSRAVWKNLTVDGTVPDLGGDPMDEYTMRNLSLQATGPDSYAMVRIRADGSRHVIADKDGKPVLLKMSALLKFGVAP